MVGILVSTLGLFRLVRMWRREDGPGHAAPVGADRGNGPARIERE